MATVTLTPDTDLADLEYQRVSITRDIPHGVGRTAHLERQTLTGVLFGMWHSSEGYVNATLREDTHGTCRGGVTSVWLPYGATITPTQ